MAQSDSLVIAALGRTEKAKHINTVAKLFHPISEPEKGCKNDFTPAISHIANKNMM